MLLLGVQIESLSAGAVPLILGISFDLNRSPNNFIDQ